MAKTQSLPAAKSGNVLYTIVAVAIDITAFSIAMKRAHSTNQKFGGYVKYGAIGILAATGANAIIYSLFVKKK